MEECNVAPIWEMCGGSIAECENKMKNSRTVLKQTKCVFLQLMGIGGMILFAGFLAFNGGSIGSMSKPGDHIVIARVVTNTVLGGSGGSLVMLAMCKLGLGAKSAWSFSHTLNAALAGMVRTANVLHL
jgi:ammonia channel protein AmtB